MRSTPIPVRTSERPPATVGDTPKLEIALLRRSISGIAAAAERCGRCERGLLLGERVYEYATGEIRCELCRGREHSDPEQSRRIHGPALGHSIRIVDRRARRTT
jgi:hypothetical protein